MSEPSTPHPRDRAIAGRDVLLDVIGHGGMGTVWRAWDLKTEDHVAAKVLAHHSSSMLLRFVREQGLRIHHPHVVAPTSWAAEDDAVVFTMDLVRGGSLAGLLAEHGPLPQSYAAILLDQLLAALEAVHEQGVVHRDVKPANLLLDPTGPGRPHLRLGDFGVAVPLDDARLTHAPGVVGTEGYMPPEQQAGEKPDPRSDLYAAGAVICEAITGVRPQPGQSIQAPAGPLHDLLAALTQPDPAQRPASASAARHTLHALGLPTDEPWRRDPRPPYVPDRIAPDPSSTAATSPGPTRVRPRPRDDRSWLIEPPQQDDTIRPEGFAVDPIAAEAMHIRMAQRAVNPLPSHLLSESPDQPASRPHSKVAIAIAGGLIIVLLVVLVLTLL